MNSREPGSACARVVACTVAEGLSVVMLEACEDQQPVSVGFNRL